MKRYLIVFYSLMIIMGMISTGCKEKLTLFAGGFTEGDEKGLRLYEFNTGNGSLKLISETDAGANPSFFCFSGNHNFIYTINEVMEFKGAKAGGLTTLFYDSGSGTIEKKSEIIVPFGGPCHISLSADKDFLFAANYESSSVAVIRLNSEGIPESVTDTILYVNETPKVSHPHMIAYDPGGKHVYLTDLGLDRIMIYDLDKSSGKLIPAENGVITLPEGSGPRHFVFNSNGSKMYVINELNSTVMVFNSDKSKGLELIQTLPTVRKDFNGTNYCAEILIGKGGNFLYGSNRGENSIVTFRIADDGTLSLAGHVSCGGDWPRNFVIDPSGKYLLTGNERSGNISIFKINQKNGIPKGPVGNEEMKAPAYLEFLK